MTQVPPIRREVLVDAGVSRAFEVFTEGIGRWWPVAELSVSGEGATVAFVDRDLVETSADGETAVWGTVTRWDEPDAVAFTWHPGRGPGAASRVEVTFTARAEQTLVTLVHDGWDAFEDPAAARIEYDHGWPMVLDRYQVAVEAPAEQTWVALMHRPHPDRAEGSQVFGDPLFAEHLAFLARMREQGYLVAAGPLGDEEGAGMTVLRLPGAEQLAEASRLATEDDASVVGGLFTVSVRPWEVVLQA